MKSSERMICLGTGTIYMDAINDDQPTYRMARLERPLAHANAMTRRLRQRGQRVIAVDLFAALPQLRLAGPLIIGGLPVPPTWRHLRHEGDWVCRLVLDDCELCWIEPKETSS